MTLTIGRRYRFAAAHRLVADRLSAADNERVFGVCHRPHGHGYALTVRVRSRVAANTGTVIDTAALDRVVADVLREVDHVRLEHDVPALQGAPATTERLIVHLHHRLAHRVAALGAELAGLDLEETRNNRFETEAAS